MPASMQAQLPDDLRSNITVSQWPQNIALVMNGTETHP